MFTKLRPRLTYANVVSTACLFIVLGGTAVAAGVNSIGGLQIRSNAVGASEIKKNAVGASELKTGAVRSSDVRDRSLTAQDFQAGQLPSGPTGPQGPAGAKGSAGATNLKTYSSAQNVCNVSLCEAVANVSCPAGSHPTGGGGYTVGGESVWSSNAPSTAGNGSPPVGWEVRFRDLPGNNAGSNAVATVICASP